MFQRINIQTLVIVLFVLAIVQPASAQQISQDHVEVYVQSDTLRLDVHVDSLFSQRTLDAIDSGMTASIAMQFRLLTDRGQTLTQRTLIKRLEHDIWEGQYRLIEQTTQPDTLVTSHFNDIQKSCSEHQGLALARLPLPDLSLTLQVRLDVNPISPEQQERTRQWLKVLKKGSLLEFFFSLERPEPSPWIDLRKFRPSALPHLLQETSP